MEKCRPWGDIVRVNEGEMQALVLDALPGPFGSSYLTPSTSPNLDMLLHVKTQVALSGTSGYSIHAAEMRRFIFKRSDNESTSRLFQRLVFHF